MAQWCCTSCLKLNNTHTMNTNTSISYRQSHSGTKMFIHLKYLNWKTMLINKVSTGEAEGRGHLQAALLGTQMAEWTNVLATRGAAGSNKQECRGEQSITTYRRIAIYRSLTHRFFKAIHNSFTLNHTYIIQGKQWIITYRWTMIYRSLICEFSKATEYWIVYA